MDDEVEAAFGGCGEDGFVALFEHAVDGVPGFVGFAAVAGDDEDAFGHSEAIVAWGWGGADRAEWGDELQSRWVHGSYSVFDD